MSSGKIVQVIGPVVDVGIFFRSILTRHQQCVDCLKKIKQKLFLKLL